ncbi:MAG TPA: disulfide bond formation protein B, partial [Burkholderiales bacterium]|nr:disulfide bond formation protein B [Burkholderiales bacterium]
ALYLQYVEHQEPCPLCIFQRIVFLAMMAVFIIAAIHGPRSAGAIVYSGLVAVFAVIGTAIATRHVWLQHLPAEQVPACGPGLEYLLKKMPLTDVLGKVLSGSGECAEVGWTFLGLSIAGWSLVWFVVLGIYAVYVGARARAQSRSHFAT